MSDGSPRFALLACLLVAGAALGVAAIAQVPDASTRGRAAGETLTREILEAELETVEADAGLEESLKALVREKYDKALGELSRAREFAETVRAYESLLESAPTRKFALESQLETLLSAEPGVTVDESRSTQSLQEEINLRRAGLASQRAELEDLAKKKAQAEAARTAGTNVASLEAELAAARGEIEKSRAEGSKASALARATTRELQARSMRLQAELEMLRYAESSAPVRLELLRVEEALLKEQIARSVAVIDALAASVAERLEGTAARAREAAAAVPAERLATSPDLQALASEVTSLAEELEKAVADTRSTIAAEAELTAEMQELAAEFASIREQLELGSGGRALVQVLFSLDRRSMDAPMRLAALELPRLEEARLSALRARQANERDAKAISDYPEPKDDILLALIGARAEVLETLDRRYGELVAALGRLERQKQEYLAQAKIIRTYIAGQLLGFGLRSSDPISLATFRELPGSFEWLFSVDHWRELMRVLGRGIARTPLSALVVLLLAAAILLRRRRIVERLESSARRLQSVRDDRYANTAGALLWTLLLALPAPVLIAYLGWATSHVPGREDWLLGLAFGLPIAAGIVFAASLTLSVLRVRGLATAHFRWNPAHFQGLRPVVIAVTGVYVVAFLIMASCIYGSASFHFDTLGRMSFVLAHLVIGVLLVRLRAAYRGIRDSGGAQRKGKKSRDWWMILLSALVVTQLALVWLACTGYMITATFLSVGMFLTLTIMAAGFLAHAMALRWFRMKERKLALERRLEQRRASHADSHEADVASEEEGQGAPSRDAENGLDLAVVGHQTRNLLRALFALATLILVLIFWSYAFPVEELAASVEIPFSGGLTLLGLALIVVVVLASVTIVRNLPGLLELTLPWASDTTHGTRYAIQTVIRYVVTALAAAVVLAILDVDWTKFGWIAAALSVGLGFGLQEVVANFVCGLIILFERPVRAGDIVTVEGMTGTVTTIRMRATTITNWDRQEFVIPNKLLITNTLLNWTLSQPVNRVVIPVGVAYGSDTRKALEILLEIADEHPVVMKDPAPIATFEQFADSSLNLVLRAYLPDMDKRLATITELHSRIHERMAEAGIEIAFPQLDLHVRSGWSGGQGIQAMAKQGPGAGPAGG